MNLLWGRWHVKLVEGREKKKAVKQKQKNKKEREKELAFCVGCVLISMFHSV